MPRRFSSPDRSALPTRQNVLRRETRAVWKCDAGAQMKGVCQAIRTDVPSFGERRLDLRARIETSEAVEQIDADRSPVGTSVERAGSRNGDRSYRASR
jgi:hypothetical protein